MFGHQMGAHLVHEVAVQVIDPPALHTFEVQMLPAVPPFVHILEHSFFALVSDIFHDALFARQLIEIPVDGGGVGAGALGLQMLQNIRRADCVLPVVDELIQDELPGFGVVSAATCHDIRLPFCNKCTTIYPSMQNKTRKLVTSTKNFVNNARKYGRISVQNGKAPNLLEKLL